MGEPDFEAQFPAGAGTAAGYVWITVDEPKTPPPLPSRFSWFVHNMKVTIHRLANFILSFGKNAKSAIGVLENVSSASLCTAGRVSVVAPSSVGLSVTAAAEILVKVVGYLKVATGGFSEATTEALDNLVKLLDLEYVEKPETGVSCKVFFDPDDKTFVADQESSGDVASAKPSGDPADTVLESPGGRLPAKQSDGFAQTVTGEAVDGSVKAVDGKTAHSGAVGAVKFRSLMMESPPTLLAKEFVKSFGFSAGLSKAAVASLGLAPDEARLSELLPLCEEMRELLWD